MTDVSAWFHSLPFFTRWWLTLSVAFPLAGRLGLLSPHLMAWLVRPFISQFQIWRPFTAVVFYPITPQTGFHFLMNLYFLYSYSLRLETGIFDGKPADYSVMLIFTWLGSLIAGTVMGFPWLMDTMVIAILHVWCQINYDVVVSFWFGTQFKAFLLPWVLLLFNLILSGSFATQLSGIIIGHAYFFLKFKYPTDFDGPSLLPTPGILYRLFPGQRGSAGISTRNFMAPPPRQPSGDHAPPPPPVNASRHNWGQGHVLGGN